jgi:hypothetical protein
MRTEFLAPSDPAWTAFLEGVPHDFYHLPGYVRLCAEREGGEAVAFLARGEGAALLLPLVLRDVPGSPWRDAVSPYGYPAPLLRGAEAAAGPLLERFAREGAEAGLVSAFLRLHPLLPFPGEALAGRGTLVVHGRTVFLDLTLPQEELDRQTRTNHRADARKLAGQGCRVAVDRWEQFPAFQELYRETMEAHDAGQAYRFDDAYFQGLRACLGDRLHLCMVLGPEGEPAAGGLFTLVDGLMQFHLAGTAPVWRRAGPGKLMLLHMRDLARDWGARILHLGGGVGCAEDSLAFFKQGFSRLRATFCTLRMVLLPAAYRELAGPAPADLSFFPAYRMPRG